MAREQDMKQTRKTHGAVGVHFKRSTIVISDRVTSEIFTDYV